MLGAMTTPSPRKLAKHGHLLCESVEAAPMASYRRYIVPMHRDGVFINPFVETNGDKRRKLISQRAELMDKINTLTDRVTALTSDLEPFLLAAYNIEKEVFPIGSKKWRRNLKKEARKEGAKEWMAKKLRMLEKNIAELRHSLDCDTDSD